MYFSTKYIVVHLDEIEKIILKMLVVSALCKVVWGSKTAFSGNILRWTLYYFLLPRAYSSSMIIYNLQQLRIVLEQFATYGVVGERKVGH